MLLYYAGASIEAEILIPNQTGAQNSTTQLEQRAPVHQTLPTQISTAAVDTSQPFVEIIEAAKFR